MIFKGGLGVIRPTGITSACAFLIRHDVVPVHLNGSGGIPRNGLWLFQRSKSPESDKSLWGPSVNNREHQSRISQPFPNARGKRERIGSNIWLWLIKQMLLLHDSNQNNIVSLSWSHNNHFLYVIELRLRVSVPLTLYLIYHRELNIKE